MFFNMNTELILLIDRTISQLHQLKQNLLNQNEFE